VAVRGLKTGIQSPPAISPDGRRIVYVADTDLWVRDLDRLEPRRLAAGVSPTFPFWSPDSSQVAYIARQKLWRVSITGGEPTLVADAGFNRGGTTPGGVWLRDGTIVFAPAANGTSLIAVPSGGGQFTEYMGRAAGESDFHKPSLLPDGESSVFVVDSNQRGADSIDVLSAGKRTTIVKEPGQVLNTPVYSPSGHLLYVREGTGAGYFGDSLGIWAVPFSLDRLQATGPFPWPRTPTGPPSATTARSSTPSPGSRATSWSCSTGTDA
jgi:Tol biopolymer transport system component